jgi:TetR/AcrR family transcriptional regulator
MTGQSHGFTMPKATFYNLPDDKRTLIEDIAIDEFAERGFEGASISAIVARAGIAKGSFYQYFEDKHDLFMHLVDLVGQRKMEAFAGHTPPDPNLDIFAYLRWALEAGMEFSAVQSKLNAAVSRVLFGEGLIHGSMFREMREQSAQVFTGMIEGAIARGDIDPRIDAPTAAFVLETLLNSAGLFILNAQAVNPDDLAAGSIAWLRSERAQEIMASLLHVIEHGLRRADSE